MGKKICPRCRKGIASKYDFCPYCGNPLEAKKGDFGMLGRTDSPDAARDELRLPMGLNTVFNSLVRNLERQFRDGKKGNDAKIPSNGFNISISAFPGFPQQVKINPPGEKRGSKKKRDDIKKFFFENFSSENFRNFQKLPRKEPEASIRRLDGKIVYEIILPGVKSAKDISIMNLESSMELKAVSEKKSYAKILPVSLPIINYGFSDGKLTLELDARGN